MDVDAETLKCGVPENLWGTPKRRWSTPQVSQYPTLAEAAEKGGAGTRPRARIGGLVWRIGRAGAWSGEGRTKVECMFVLGIDPGLSRCGFGVVESVKRGEHRCVEYGVMSTSPDDDIHIRLASMMEQMETLLDRLQPAVVVVERVFFQTNARTAMGVGQASGLALALSTRRGAQVAQYTSNEVKQTVAGYGAADKKQMQEMVARLLKLDTLPKPADAADALGLALCHLAMMPMLIAAKGAASVGRAINDGPTAAFGGRPLRIATSVGGAALASPKQQVRS